MQSAVWPGPHVGDHWLRETHYDVVRRTKADDPGRPFVIDRTRDGALTLHTAVERRQLQLIAGAA